MTDHLPECWWSAPEAGVPTTPCICAKLRACEQRVILGGNADSQIEGYGRWRYQQGVQAARDAVTLMPWSSDTWQAHDERANALAAIDNLMEK